MPSPPAGNCLLPQAPIDHNWDRDRGGKGSSSTAMGNLGAVPHLSVGAYEQQPNFNRLKSVQLRNYLLSSTAFNKWLAVVLQHREVQRWKKVGASGFCGNESLPAPWARELWILMAP